MLCTLSIPVGPITFLATGTILVWTLVKYFIFYRKSQFVTFYTRLTRLASAAHRLGTYDFIYTKSKRINALHWHIQYSVLHCLLVRVQSARYQRCAEITTIWNMNINTYEKLSPHFTTHVYAPVIWLMCMLATGRCVILQWIQYCGYIIVTSENKIWKLTVVSANQ